MTTYHLWECRTQSNNHPPILLYLHYTADPDQNTTTEHNYVTQDYLHLKYILYDYLILHDYTMPRYTNLSLYRTYMMTPICFPRDGSATAGRPASRSRSPRPLAGPRPLRHRRCWEWLVRVWSADVGRSVWGIRRCDNKDSEFRTQSHIISYIHNHCFAVWQSFWWI